MEAKTTLEVVLEAWKALEKHRDPDAFSIVYRKLEGLPDKENPQGSIVREKLGNYLTIQRCAAYLFLAYPGEHFTTEQLEKCQFIFWTIVQHCTYVEMSDDLEFGFEFGFEDYYPAGCFCIARSVMLKKLFNAPEIIVWCFDVDHPSPKFTMLELLTQNQVYETWIQSWEARPAYQSLYTHELVQQHSEVFNQLLQNTAAVALEAKEREEELRMMVDLIDGLVSTGEEKMGSVQQQIEFIQMLCLNTAAVELEAKEREEELRMLVELDLYNTAMISCVCLDVGQLFDELTTKFTLSNRELLTQNQAYSKLDSRPAYLRLYTRELIQKQTELIQKLTQNTAAVALKAKKLEEELRKMINLAYDP